jgi:hypothetical protein
MLLQAGNIRLARIHDLDQRLRYAMALAARSRNRPWWSVRKAPPDVDSFLDLAHHDGHRREATLRTPGLSLDVPLAWGLALYRLNDWVPEVRVAAREMLPIHAQSANPAVLATSFLATLLEDLQWLRVTDQEEQAMAAVFCVPGVAEVMRSKLIAAMTGPASRIARQASRFPDMDSQWEEVARQSVQPSVRAVATRILISQKAIYQVNWQEYQRCPSQTWRRSRRYLRERVAPTGLTFVEAIELSAQDRSAQVRRIAADALVRATHRLSREEWAIAEKLAVDRHASIRSLAQFVLQRRQSPDASEDTSGL